MKKTEYNTFKNRTGEIIILWIGLCSIHNITGGVNPTPYSCIIPI